VGDVELIGEDVDEDGKATERTDGQADHWISHSISQLRDSVDLNHVAILL
jgi:hypothetical protein